MDCGMMADNPPNLISTSFVETCGLYVSRSGASSLTCNLASPSQIHHFARVNTIAKLSLVQLSMATPKPRTDLGDLYYEAELESQKSPVNPLVSH